MSTITIAERKVGDGARCFVVAEAGVNHNGALDLALRLADVAADAGADAVKFQTFQADRVIAASAPKAAYQTRTTDAGESQLDMVRKLELKREFHRPIAERCAARGILFMSTAFDDESAHFLADELKVPVLKVPSGEVTNAPLLLALARFGLPMILSTGMSMLAEVKTALGVLAFGLMQRQEPPSAAAFADTYASASGRRALADKVILLHCTSEYPAAFDETNLRAMDAMREAFDLPVGLSDHTPGIAVPIAAVARGAVAVEKHFTLDRTMSGPDHKASLEPGELAAMVAGIRAAEAALGRPVKEPTAAELRNRPIVRRGLVAARAIALGETFTADNVTAKRPATGLSPLRYWDLIGRPARRAYAPDEPIGERDEL
ncbi:MAG TPA: N-acetylneuraminate synthase [Stellaceae bacterium]|nr:N-acetylneuraminate synthase [Stellaceae bacterium]